MDNDLKVDLCFSIRGETVPVDHGFDLYSCISKLLPSFHEAQDVGLKMIRGRYVGDGLLSLQPNSWLVFRLRSSGLSPYINLAGNSLNLRGHLIQIGVPKTKALNPAPALYSHLVTTRNGQDQERFLTEVDRQLSQMGVNAEIHLGDRKTFTIHDKKIVGYSIQILGLSDEDSIKVQEQGLGGRKKMGCGFIEPTEHDQ
jgi:CRISPR-associated protein Cas6